MKAIFTCNDKSCTSSKLEATPDGYKLNSTSANRVLKKIDNNHDPIRCRILGAIYEVNVYYDKSFLLYPLI